MPARRSAKRQTKKKPSAREARKLDALLAPLVAPLMLDTPANAVALIDHMESHFRAGPQRWRKPFERAAKRWALVKHLPPRARIRFIVLATHLTATATARNVSPSISRLAGQCLFLGYLAAARLYEGEQLQ
jgi:hypothetical protein